MSDEIVTVRLYGRFGTKFGRVHKLAVNSAAEAVRALGTQLRGFDKYLTEAKDNGFDFAVFYDRKNLTEDGLTTPVNGREIRIAPILFGSKNGSWLQVILGVVLIVVGAYMGWTPLVNLGWGLVVGGVTQLLAPSPPGLSSRDRPENLPSYAFNGPINTQAQGNPVPVLYGELIVGSAVLSAGINAVDQAYVPRGPGGGSGGGGGGGSPPWYENRLGV